MADPHSKDPRVTGRTNLSGPAADVPHRVTDSHRDTGSSGPASYKAHTMAPEKQLEGPRVPRKGDINPQVAPPSSEMVAGGKQCASRSTITPTKTCSADFYGHIKRRMGHSLKQMHCKGNVVPSRKQVTHKLPGTKSSLSGPKRVQRPLPKQHSTHSYRQHHGCCLHEQPRGMKSGLLRGLSICLSTCSLLGQSGGEVTGLPVQENHSDCSRWPNKPWFWDLVTMSSHIPLCLPNLLRQPFNQTPHRNLSNLNLHVWLLEPQQSSSRASLRQWQQRGSTRSVYEAVGHFTKWCLGHQVGLRAPPVKSIADLLTYSRTGSYCQVQLMGTDQPLLTNC